MRNRFQRVQDDGARMRAWVIERPGGPTIWRVFIAISGGLVVLAGLIMIPFPGPGWLVVFLGIGIWGTEFTWARRLLAWTRAHVEAAGRWAQRRPMWQRILGSVAAIGFTVAVVLFVVSQGWFGVSLPGRLGGLDHVG